MTHEKKRVFEVFSSTRKYVKNVGGLLNRVLDVFSGSRALRGYLLEFLACLLPYAII